MNRQMGVKKFIRVVILDPPTTGHVTAHAQPQNCHGPLSTGCVTILQVSLKLSPIDKKFQDNIRTTKMCPAMQYCDVITNPRWRTAAILKIAKSPVKNHPILIKFGTLQQIMNPMTVTLSSLRYLLGVKPRSVNFANASDSPRNGCGVGHVTAV